MFYFPNTRKPDWKAVRKINYDDYWRVRGFSVATKLKERESIILTEIEAGAMVLDVGCGNSRLPVELKAKGCQVIVADISPLVLAGYKSQGIPGMVLDLSMPEAKDMPDFDYIIASEVLEHLSDPEGAINFLKKRGKSLVISVPNSAFYRYRLHLFFVGRFFTQWVAHPSEHLRFWSHIDFLEWLVAEGLVINKVLPSNGLSLLGIPLYKLWPNLFAHQIVYFCQGSNQT